MALSSEAIGELQQALGAGAVDRDPQVLAAYGHDTWPLSTKEAMAGHHPNAPHAVVRITEPAAAAKVFEIATRHAIAVTVRALGSSVTGQPLPVRGGIVLDVTGIPATISVNTTNMTVTAACSVNGGELEDHLAERGLTLGHSPQSLYRSSVGGWVATLATGQFSSMYGGIEDLIDGYSVLLATGEEIAVGSSPRAAMGPDLRQIFIGSEGTLGLVTSVTLKVFPAGLPTAFDAFALPSVSEGLRFLREESQLGLRPLLLRLYDADEARHAMPGAGVDVPVLFVGTRGPEPICRAEMEVLAALAQRCGGRSLGPAPVEAWMKRRFDFSSVENRLAEPGGFAETIEVAHTWDGIEGLYEGMKSALGPLADEVLMHFSHTYPQGTSMYAILLGRAEDDEAAIARLREIWSTAMGVCLQRGAVLSHHHGGGLARSPYSERSLGSAHLILRRIKAALDPAGILNPGKLGL